MVVTSINLIIVCQHTDVESTGLEDAILHWQLPIMYKIGGLLRRLLEATADCRLGQQYDGKCSFYFNNFFRTTTTNRDLWEKVVYFPPRHCPGMENWNQDLPERYSNFCGLYIKFRGHGKWPWTWWGRRKSQGHRPCRPGHGKWRKACINICKHIEVLKLCIVKSANK